MNTENRTIVFHCKKCKKSMRMSYMVSGNPDTIVMSGIMMKCNTHKCVRVMTCKKYTEGQLVDLADKDGKVFL